MVAVRGQTFQQLRQAIGYNLNGVLPGAMFVGSATENGDTTSLIDAKLRGANDNYNGGWVVPTSGDNSGSVVRVDDTVIDTPGSGDVDLTLVPALGTATASGDTYELWDEQYPPARLNSLINQAINAIVGRHYDPVEDISLFSNRRESRFALPSDVYMIRKLLKRSSVTSKSIFSGGAAMDESVDSDFTVTLDTEVYQKSTSNKIVVAGTVNDGDIVTDSMSAVDLSRYTHIEFWMRVSADVASDDLRLLLDDTAACASPVETLTIPAITAAERWKRVRIALANPHSDTAIISIGLEYNANAKANTIHIEDVTVINADTEVWTEVPWRSWSIDKEARELVLKSPMDVGYAALKILGGDYPANLSSETDVTEVSEEYIIAYATARALMGKVGPNGEQYAAVWFQQAERLRLSQRLPVGARRAS